MSARAFIAGAFASAVTANLIHNNGGLDPAIAPAAILISVYWWRSGQLLLRLTAVAIALPAFAFLSVRALGDPTALQPFLNHLALLLAGIMAVFAVGKGFLDARPLRRRA